MGPGCSTLPARKRETGERPFGLQADTRSPVPRTRGDGPCWTLDMPVQRRLFPAHAGMDRSSNSRRLRRRLPVPRTRGDGPLAVGAWRSRGQDCSPHTRGWTERNTHGECGAQAVPRTRGDGPEKAPPPAGSHSPVPRTRGDGPTNGPNDPTPGTSVPRTRGDGPATLMLEGLLGLNCSPHTRGWTGSHQRGWKQSSDLFPAHAGMDRGGGVDSLDPGGLFPAHAGMDRGYMGTPPPGLPVPRTRGDGPS